MCSTRTTRRHTSIFRNGRTKVFSAIYQEESGEVFYELSSYSSKVIDWLLSLKKDEFVGTESKFMNLYGQIKELVEFTNEDPEERIHMLEQKKMEIEHQIQSHRAANLPWSMKTIRLLHVSGILPVRQRNFFPILRRWKTILSQLQNPSIRNMPREMCRKAISWDIRSMRSTSFRKVLRERASMLSGISL